MKKILVFMLTVVSCSVFAGSKTFDVKIDLSIDGKLVSSPRMTVVEGAKGSITQENSHGQKNFIEVVVTEGKATGGEQPIHMNFIVATVTKDGVKKIIAQPKITALPNEKAQITVGEDGRPQAFSLTVIANKVAL